MQRANLSQSPVGKVSQRIQGQISPREVSGASSPVFGLQGRGLRLHVYARQEVLHMIKGLCDLPGPCAEWDPTWIPVVQIPQKLQGQKHLKCSAKVAALQPAVGLVEQLMLSNVGELKFLSDLLCDEFGRVIKVVPKNGNDCMFTAILEQLALSGQDAFPPILMRRMVVNHIIQDLEVCMSPKYQQVLKDFLVGKKITLKQYLYLQATGMLEGDDVILHGLSRMWNCSITVINYFGGTQFQIQKVDHNVPHKETDFVLVRSGSHYSAAVLSGEIVEEVARFTFDPKWKAEDEKDLTRHQKLLMNEFLQDNFPNNPKIPGLNDQPREELFLSTGEIDDGPPVIIVPSGSEESSSDEFDSPSSGSLSEFSRTPSPLSVGSPAPVTPVTAPVKTPENAPVSPRDMSWFIPAVLDLCEAGILESVVEEVVQQHLQSLSGPCSVGDLLEPVLRKSLLRSPVDSLSVGVPAAAVAEGVELLAAAVVPRSPVEVEEVLPPSPVAPVAPKFVLKLEDWETMQKDLLGLQQRLLHLEAAPAPPVTTVKGEAVASSAASEEKHCTVPDPENFPSSSQREVGVLREAPAAKRMKLDVSASKDKQFSCTTCQKSFKTSVTLRFHCKNTCASVERRFPCTEGGCAAKFSTAVQLKNHQLKVHSGLGPEADRTCPTCHRVFLEKFKCQQHIRSHSSPEPTAGVGFCCDLPGCGKCFSTRKLLLAHQKRVHDAHGLKGNRS